MRPDAMIVTAALPYANGSIHLGHLVEYIQTDIYVRFHKMRGQQCLYFCADDTHGAPIMIRAKNEGVSPETIIEKYHEEHQRDFAGFSVEFDNYHSTNSDENRELAEEIYLKLKEGGSIIKRDVEQAFCEHDGMFLPDRFVRGICPKCSAEDQYGDSCDSCGSHYSSTDLKEPKCSLCGSAPTQKTSSHLFFRVADYAGALEKFMDGNALQDEVKNFLLTWMKEGLKEWDISRDGPYFGFEIPGEKDKYFYVWLDAPVGYIASAKNWAEKNGKDFDKLWRDEKAVIHHFIGKDIVYFHTLFWIPMLKGSGFTLPSKIQVHGFLTVNGEKMSKSKGTFILAKDYLDNLNPEYLRYYYACKLKNSIDDIDLNFDDFKFRVNAELVNKIANLGSRTISILNKNKTLENRLGTVSGDGANMVNEMRSKAGSIEKFYEDCDFSHVTKEVSHMADRANEFIDRAAPWRLKDNPEKLQEVLTIGINAFRLISIYLKPVIPAFAQKVEKILNTESFKWSDTGAFLENHTIGKFERLADRIDDRPIEKLLDSSKKTIGAEKEKSEMIEFDDFLKVDLRTAFVEDAKRVEKSDKLLKLSVKVGDETRTIVAGLGQSYSPDEIKGKTVVIVANLKPRKLMGITSEGMVLAVNAGDGLSVLNIDGEAGDGLRVS